MSYGFLINTLISINVYAYLYLYFRFDHYNFICHGRKRFCFNPVEFFSWESLYQVVPTWSGQLIILFFWMKGLSINILKLQCKHYPTHNLQLNGELYVYHKGTKWGQIIIELLFCIHFLILSIFFHGLRVKNT